MINACEDNVLSLAGNFSSTCDGHLVSVEKDGRYKTQTLSIVLKENRKGELRSWSEECDKEDIRNLINQL